MSEAVKMLIEVEDAPEQSRKRAGYAIWKYWTAKGWFATSYVRLRVKVKAVQQDRDAMHCEGLSLEDIIKKHCQRADRAKVNIPATAGRPEFLTPSEFKKQVGSTCSRQKGAGKTDVMSILATAKKQYHDGRGLHARSAEVSRGTYRKYMQHTGGDDLPVRAVVLSRSKGRQIAAKSDRHTCAYLFSIMHSHIFPAPVGMGMDPPPTWTAS